MLAAETRSVIDEIITKFDGVRDPSIPILQEVQRTLGCVDRDSIEYISEATGIPRTDIFGVVTFYAFLRLQPPGRHTIKVCRGTACHVKGGARVLKELERRLGIRPGETSEDGMFSLETVACVGACALAPTVVLDDEVYSRMTPRKVTDLVERVREDEEHDD